MKQTIQYTELDGQRFCSPEMLIKVAQLKKHWHREIKKLRRKMEGKA